MQQKMWKGCVLVTKIDVKVVVVRDQVSIRIGNYYLQNVPKKKWKSDIELVARMQH